MRSILPFAAAASMLVAACAQEGMVSPPGNAPSLSITPPGVTAGRPPLQRASYNSVNTSRPVVALTFDDGPHPELTPQLLDILRREGVRATFFVIGRNVDAYPEIARRIVAEGHEIANHSYTHPPLPSVGAARLRDEMVRTNESIMRATGRCPTAMRPPYGAINERVRQSIINDHRLDVVLWSVDPLDWKRPGAGVVADRLVQGAHPGAILLAHDIHPGTIEAVPDVIARLKAKGYGFATVSQLFALQEPPSAATQVARHGTAVR
ncbi:MAG: polysaccharide deacetylase family protein [Chthoniobacterales bacterium]|nr:polysaccharide deacetylase family protein [Chthoniobacterales bacterium]